MKVDTDFARRTFSGDTGVLDVPAGSTLRLIDLETGEPFPHDWASRPYTPSSHLSFYTGPRSLMWKIAGSVIFDPAGKPYAALPWRDEETDELQKPLWLWPGDRITIDTPEGSLI